MTKFAILALAALALTACSAEPKQEPIDATPIPLEQDDPPVGSASPADPSLTFAEKEGLPRVYTAEGFQTRIVYYNPNCTVIEIKRPDGQVLYMGQGYRMACSLAG